MNPKLEATLTQLAASGETVTDSKTIYAVGRENGLSYKQISENFITDETRISRGKYDVSRSVYAMNTMRAPVADVQSNSTVPSSETAASVQPVRASRAAQPVMTSQKVIQDLEEICVPKVDPTYVPWGEFNTVKNAIASRLFFPLFICGPTGNGKTFGIEQACAKLKRKCLRFQVTPETDETAALGGFRLIDGETVFYKGPIVRAMEAGAVLLLDEIDRASNKLAMALQSIMEGNSVLLKQIGQVIAPAPGFTIIATANTKGRGSEDGRYSAANILDEAFMERFIGTIDQEYPSEKVEKEIVSNHMALYGVKDDDFVDKLVAWSLIIRKTYESDGVDELISTRRLCHITKAYSVFRDRSKAISLCIARFDEDTRAAFNDLYSKIDDSAAKSASPEATDSTNYSDPF